MQSPATLRRAEFIRDHGSHALLRACGAARRSAPTRRRLHCAASSGTRTPSVGTAALSSPWIIIGAGLLAAAGAFAWARRQVRGQRARVVELVDCIPSPALILDTRTGRIEHGNAAARELYGYGAREWPASGLSGLEFEPAGAGTTPAGRELWRHRHRSGKPLIIEVIASMTGVPDARGRCVVLRDITEPTAERMSADSAAESLRISESRYRRLVEGIDVISWELSLPDYRFTFVSEPAERLLGYPVAKWYEPDFWYRHVHPADIDDAVAYCKAQTEEGLDHTFEYRMIAADGREVWLRDMVTVVKDGTRAVSLRGALVDITAEKRAREELDTERQRYRAIVDAHPDLICRFTPDCRLTFVNDAYAAFFGGGDAASLIGRDFTEFISPDQREEVARHFISLSRPPTNPISEEQEAQGSSGEVRRFVWHNSVARIADGRCVEFQGVGRDVTALRVAEAAVARRDEIMRTMAGAAGLMMAAPRWEDAVPTLLARLGSAASAGCLCLTARDAENPEGHRLVGHWSVTEGTSPEDQMRLLAELSAASASTQAPVVEERSVGVPVLVGTATWGMLAASAHPERTPWTEGEIDALRSFAALLGACIQRAAMTDELRTADEQLRQSQKLEAVGQLASGVAHDFNNLLTAIQGYVGLAKSSLPTSHPAVESLEQVEEASRQATGVANALLTFTRRGKGQRRAVELLAVIEPALRLLRRTLPANIAIVVEPGDGPAWVDGDSTQLQQVILNLTINARDAMPGGGTIRVRIERPTSAEAVIVISDTGTGMSDPVRTRVFEPFFTTKPKGTGTGLGLSIVHGIVVEHGGTIALESTLGEGSTFRVSLPTVPAPSDITLGSPPPRTLLRGDVLVVEDDQLVRGLVCSMLAALGYGVVAASNAAEADGFVRSGRAFAAALIDVELPDRSGSSLLAEWRDRGHRFPAVVVTGHTHTPVPETPDSRTSLLHKPFRMADLRQVMESIGSPDPADIR